MSPIPDVEPGDTVWWHADGVHAVEPVAEQKGWGNVMYIPAAPYCAKNAAYAEACGRAFLAGESPADFAPSTTRPTGPGALAPRTSTPTGRSQLGLDG
jgi:Protein of unknown function (DUF1479)